MKGRVGFLQDWLSEERGLERPPISAFTDMCIQTTLTYCSLGEAFRPNLGGLLSLPT